MELLIGLIKALIWLLIILWPLTIALIIGGVRLYLGRNLRYEKSLKDVSDLKIGDIILTGRQELTYSWYIQLSNVWTRKLKHRFWTHAAIYAGNGKVWEAQPEGIREWDINNYFNDGFIVRAYRHRYISDENILNKVIEFCASKKGYSYGTIGVIFYTLSTLVPVSFNSLFDNKFFDKTCKLDNAYFCSELIVDAFDEIGYPISPFDGWRVKPTDFISNPMLESVSSNIER